MKQTYFLNDKLSKLTPEKIEKIFLYLLKKLKKKKKTPFYKENSRLKGFTGESQIIRSLKHIQIFEKEITPILQRLFQKIVQEEILSNSFHEAIAYAGTIVRQIHGKKRKEQTNSLHKPTHKILNKNVSKLNLSVQSKDNTS